MVSKEEYVKYHMKMSLGVKIAIIIGLAALVGVIILFVNLFPCMMEICKSFIKQVKEWIKWCIENDEDAGEHIAGFILLFWTLIVICVSVIYIFYKRKELGDYYYVSYCEYKSRERRFVSESEEIKDTETDCGNSEQKV